MAAANNADDGTGREVLVVAHDLAAGEELDAEATAHVVVSAAAVPDDALGDIPTGSRARVQLRAGDVLTERSLSGAGSELAAKVGEGRRAVTLTNDRSGLTLSEGDSVELMGIDEDGSVVVLSADGRVIDTTDDSVTVSVDSSDVSAVIEAQLASTLAVALSGGT